MAVFGLAEPAVTLAEAQAYVRIETGEEEAIVAGLIRTASALCETFINQVVIARAFGEDLPASGGWERLGASPVRSISNVESIDEDGAPSALLTGDYAVDVDSAGDGWVRVLDCVPEIDGRRRFHSRRPGRRTEAASHPGTIGWTHDRC